MTTYPQTGSESFAMADVLRALGREALLRLDGRIRPVDFRRIAVDRAPSNLHSRPTLVLDLARAGVNLEIPTLSNLTGGLNWKTDYVAQLSKDETTIRLAGWLTPTNETETAFENARLRAVTGTISRASQPPWRKR